MKIFLRPVRDKNETFMWRTFDIPSAYNVYTLRGMGNTSLKWRIN